MEDLTLIKEDALRKIKGVFTDEGWEVESNPIVGGYRTDFVATDKANHRGLVIQLKLGKGDAGIGELGHMTELRTALQKKRGADQSSLKYDAVLVTNLGVENDIQEFANRWDVNILEVLPSSDGIVGSVKDFLVFPDA